MTEETFYCSGLSHYGDQGTIKKCGCIECEPYRNRILKIYNSDGITAAITEMKNSTHRDFQDRFQNHIKKDLNYLRGFVNENRQ